MGFANLAQGHGDWFTQNPIPADPEAKWRNANGTINEGVNTPGGNQLPNESAQRGPGQTPAGATQATGALAGMSDQQKFEAAAQALGIPLGQTRGRQQEIAAWLNQNDGPGWQAGANADDWIRTPSGQGIDFSAAGSNAFQWNNDPANSQGGGSAFGSFAQPYGQTFSAPSAQDAANTPGYQFQFDQGLRAVDAGAAAKGDLLTGGTIKAEQIFGQGLASTTYGQSYDRAYQQYMNSYNMWRNNQNDVWGRENDVANRGLSATNGATS